MPLSTARHGLPKIDLSFAPDGPTQIDALADAVDTALPYVSETTPDPVSGLVWYKPSTGRLRISDGTSWFDPAPRYGVTGTVLSGVFDATKPVNTQLIRQSGTTDVNALAVINIAGLSAVCVMSTQAIFESNSTSVFIFKVRYDLCSTSTVAFQMHNPSTGAAAASTPYTIQARVDYQ